MKTFLLFCGCLLCYATGFTQIYAGTGGRKFSSSELEKLKNTTTIFVLRQQDIPRRAEIEQAFQQSWTITPYKIITFEELPQYAGKTGFSFFTLTGLQVMINNAIGWYYYLTLWIPKGKKKDIEFCRIDLFPDTHSMISVNFFNDEKGFEQLYTNSYFYNLTPGLLACYLKSANDYLEKEKTREDNVESYDPQELVNLRKDTLYVPDYVFIHFSPFNGREKVNEDEEDLFKNYPFPHIVMSELDLTHLILSEKKPHYVLVYVKSCNTKLITIYNTQTGKIIYNDVTKISYNIKEKDIAWLAKEIAK